MSKRKFGKKNHLEELDENWKTLVIYCVGSMIDPSITGIRIVDSSSIKKNEYNGTCEFKLLYRIELWFDNVSKRAKIEEEFKNIMNLDDSKLIFYKEHLIE